MIAFLGDIHGEFYTLQRLHDEIIQHPEVTAIVQVGDFGFYPRLLEKYKLQLKLPIYAIDGNHEDFNFLLHRKEVEEVVPNVFYVPRGTVLELDGRTIAFLGGAASVDADYRQKYGRHWDTQENMTEEDIARFREATKDKKIDIMVTHVPPQSVIQLHFDPHNLSWFGLPPTWKDPNADYVQRLWTELGKPPIISGHMHRHVVEGTARILDINEIYCI